MMTPLIGIEEHFFSPLAPERRGIYVRPNPQEYGPIIPKKLADIGPARLQDMASASVAMTVLSHLQVIPEPEACTSINDDTYSKIVQHLDRYAAFALLPLNDPAKAATELRRCVQDLGFVGALTPNHLDDGSFFDSPRFYPLWEAAQELDVPIYIHPTFSPEAETEVNFKGPYDAKFEKAIGLGCWGWHSRMGVHILRLYAAGIFDKFPKVKIIIGHMGEMLPFMLDRIIRLWPASETPRRGLREVWDGNIWITTSGMFSLAPMACLLQETKIERILFSCDYPFAEYGVAREFMERLKASGLVGDEDWEKIAWKNSKELLRLKFEVKE
ncbi:hypothetical protein CH063_09313 [Colletotrichum higginsianum]|uniref:Amidohydrolase-related domain-containing protein n=2 Tax=Colletotrichum higginsianum (strain IMI 349063) TaxID=759273 RepID=H1VD50_COLHI|nr:hypothetical protein CH063_09313 [Colletotrichum higginsianum]